MLNYVSVVPLNIKGMVVEAITPERVYVPTDAGTYSAAFHYAFYLWKMGATIVGVPSSQALNTIPLYLLDIIEGKR